MKILLVVYDNGSYIHCFPQGLAYLASVLRNEGHEITIYNQDQYHYPEAHLVEYLKKNHFDVVGVSIIGGYYQYKKLLLLSEAINSVPDRPFYMLGGHGPAPEPEFFLRKTKADVIAIGEGEIIAVNLLNALETKKDLSTVKGIAYLDAGDKLIVTERQKLIKDINTIPLPAWDLFPVDYYALQETPRKPRTTRSFYVLTSRGCTFRCNFCYRMDKGYRARSPESVIEEVEILKKKYYIDHMVFSDELVMSSPKRTFELCEAIIHAGLNITWECNGRLNYATPEVLSVMSKAGCVFINYGIESMDDKMLKTMNKNLTTEMIHKGVQATLDSGISPGLNILFGNIGETAEVLQKGVDFLLKYDDLSQFRTIRPVTPYPGSDLYYYAIKKGLLKDCEDFYENKHLNSDLMAVNFTDLSDEKFYEALYEANITLMEHHYKRQLKTSKTAAKKLYIERDPNFRGFRQV